MNIASRRFYHNYGNYRDRRKSEAGIMSYFYLAWLQVRVLYSALLYRRQRYALHSFKQLGALYMHNHDDKYPARPGFKPSTSGLQAPVYANEPSGPAHWGWSTSEKSVYYGMDWWSWGSILSHIRLLYCLSSERKIEVWINLNIRFQCTELCDADGWDIIKMLLQTLMMKTCLLKRTFHDLDVSSTT